MFFPVRPELVPWKRPACPWWLLTVPFFSRPPQLFVLPLLFVPGAPFPAALRLAALGIPRSQCRLRLESHLASWGSV